MPAASPKRAQNGSRNSASASPAKNSMNGNPTPKKSKTNSRDESSVFSSPLLPILLTLLPALVAYSAANPGFSASIYSRYRGFIADAADYISLGDYYTPRPTLKETLPAFDEKDYSQTSFAADASRDRIIQVRWKIGEFVRRLGTEDPVDKALMDVEAPSLDSEDRFALLKLHAAFAMDRKRSTTKVPISSLSPPAKSLLARDPSGVPSRLHNLLGTLADGDTVAIWHLRAHLNRLFLRLLFQTCVERLDKCREMINAQDEFGMDLVRRLWADGNVAAVRFAREVLAAQEGGDRFERYNRNLTFANFVSNSRKWTNEEKKEAECEVPVVRIREGSEVDGFKEVRRLILEGEPVLVRGVGRLLPGGWELLKLDIGKVVDEVESAEDGEQAVKVGSVPYAGYFGLGTERMPLGKFYREFVAQNRSLEGIKGAPYAFAKNPRVTKLPLSVLSEFVQHVFQGDDKPIICPIRDGKNGAGESIHFYLGRAGTGAPTHVHADAMNLLVRGWKRWFVHPPLQSLYSRTPATEYPHILSLLPNHPKPLSCLQRPGDIFYVPFDWGHAVLNEVDSLDGKMGNVNFGVAVEVVNRREVGLGVGEEGCE